MCNFAIEPMRPSLSREATQSSNESLKLDTGRDLRAVGPNFIGITAVLVVVIEKPEAKFGIDVPGNIAAEPTIALHCDGGIKVKAADIHFAGHVERLVQLIPAANSDIGIGPILGETETPIELCLQDPGNSLLRCHRVLPGVSDESE